MKPKCFGVISIACAMLVMGFAGFSAAGSGDTDCELTFSLKGWSALYKTASGQGRVKCENGQSANVEISVKGGGLTFGKSEIIGGTGKISEVKNIDAVFGSYVAAEAHAGVVKSSSASLYTKGEVSMALVGTGKGVDLGVAFGKFTIKKVK